jgi:hypothetical protein
VKVPYSLSHARAVIGNEVLISNYRLPAPTL